MIEFGNSVEGIGIYCRKFGSVIDINEKDFSYETSSLVNFITDPEEIKEIFIEYVIFFPQYTMPVTKDYLTRSWTGASIPIEEALVYSDIDLNIIWRSKYGKLKISKNHYLIFEDAIKN